MKTAMQELIEKLEEKIKEFNTKWDGNPLARTGFILSINEAKKLLEKEKEQIMNAFSRGLGTELSDWENSQQYYDRIYNQNK
jgi:hypothetical protein